MRTLLIDNYDSFTHNLAQRLAVVSGVAPLVVRNDEAGWRAERLAEFDAVVISPGPGTPERAGDFGICREVIERCAVPLLGVCLGHQGIAVRYGARVVRAPEPVHGRVSAVVHEGDELFAGIASPFDAVRYHSLAVAELPGELTALARTADGVLMALRHRTRPQWGVQFHPESIGMRRDGDRLLANFAALAAAERRRAPRERITVRAEAEAAAEAASPAVVRSYELLVEPLGGAVDAEAAFDAVFRHGPYAFWLDSSRAGDGPGRGRFSVLGDGGGPLARVATADVADGTVTVRSAAGEERVAGAFLDWLDADLRAHRLAGGPRPPGDFALGWVGHLGYELKAQCGGRAAHRADGPDAAVVFADRAVVVDHVGRETYLLALVSADGRDEADRWVRETAARLAALPGRVADGQAPEAPVADGPTEEGAAPEGPPRDAPPTDRPASDAPLPAVPHAPALELAAPPALRHGRARYLELVAAAQEEIAAGETYEVCLTNRVTAPLASQGPDTAWRAYRVMRRAAPAPFGALLCFGETAVLSTSPERFLRVTEKGRAESRPIKGTRPRGETPERDAALRRDLAESEKDRSENLMIVDLVRNDLGRVAVTGSVEVTGLFEVETYDTVHQLVSTVAADLRPGVSAVDCVRAAFPAGSMTGAPKVRTMRIIDRLEGGPRGVYAGAVGYFSLTGAADLSVVIRTAVLTPGLLSYGTGGAVVALSDPEAEFAETAVKAAPLLSLTGGTFPGVIPRDTGAG